MSTAGHSAKKFSQNEASHTNAPTSNDTINPHNNSPAPSSDTSDQKHSCIPDASKLPVRRDQPSESTTPSTPEDSRSTRQIIAVSASKGPAAFFNLSRKFLVTDEEVDLSALEGAIVSAVDAAHLLERSKLATIVRVHTSYVSVEPKRRKSTRLSEEASSSADAGSFRQPSLPNTPPTASSHGALRTRTSAGQSDRELRRSRVVITMRRTATYKQWLEDNPLQAIAAGEEGDEDDVDDDDEEGNVEQSHH